MLILASSASGRSYARVVGVAEDVDRRRAAYWDKQAGRYDREMDRWDRRLFGDSRPWVCGRAVGDVLEVAVGTGRNLPFYPDGVRLTGIDWSPAMLGIARERAAALGRDADLRPGDAQGLDFPDGSFDTVLCALGLCAIPDDRRAVTEMARVLRPGGRLLLVDHVAAPARTLRAAQWLYERISIPLAGEHFRRRPLTHVRELGFLIEETQRLKLGIVERVCARKAKLAPLRSQCPETGLEGSLMYDATLAETVTIRGDGGDEIEAYLARPMSQGPFGGVVVIHHMPGYDAETKEIARRFAAHRYNALVPNLYHRVAPGASPDDAAAAARAQGGVPDARLIGDVAGAAAYLRGLSNSNGKVGVIGYCSGGRQSVLAACSLPLNAAVDCYGAFVVGTPPEGMPLKVGPIKHLIKDLSSPLLGLFGADDQYPSPEQVKELEEELKAQGKTYEFHTYEGAGHAFFAVNRTAYRPEAAVDGWEKIFTWFGRYLAG